MMMVSKRGEVMFTTWCRGAALMDVDGFGGGSSGGDSGSSTGGGDGGSRSSRVVVLPEERVFLDFF